MKHDTADALVQLRLKGHKHLKITSVWGMDFIHRPLTYFEHETIEDLGKEIDAPELNELIIALTVLYPTEKEIEHWVEHQARAADPDILAQRILDHSIFNNPDRIIEETHLARHRSQVVPSMIEIYICSVYKSLKPEDVGNMSMYEQLDLLAKAESVIGQQIHMESIKKPDPEQPQQQRPNIPVPEGMESTPEMNMDFLLSSDAADVPDFKNMNA